LNRIFLTISVLSNAFLVGTYVLGWAVRDASIPGSTGIGLPLHFLCGVGALTLAMLVHAIVLTYFMGTGRWIEETTAAYRLGATPREESIRFKYRTLPGMVGCLTLLILIGGFGAAADPGAALDFSAAKTVHMVLATLGLLANLTVSVVEYESISRNGRLIIAIMDQVRTIRKERGLDAPTEGEIREEERSES
jgi:hypothetical protein